MIVYLPGRPHSIIYYAIAIAIAIAANFMVISFSQSNIFVTQKTQLCPISAYFLEVKRHRDVIWKLVLKYTTCFYV